MKATISSVIIIAVVTLTCIFTTRYTDSVCRDTKKLLEQSAAFATIGDWNTASRLFDAADERYTKSEPYLKAYIPHKALDEVYNTLLRIEAAIALRDTVTCNTEINCLCGYLERLESADALSAPNLF